MIDYSQGMLIHRIFSPVTVLGPGKERLGIWTQGCTIHCPGCMTPESWEFDQKYFLDFKSIENLIIKSNLEGYTSIVISGGEPFDQSDGLFILLSQLRRHNFTDILVFSGYRYDQILEKFPNHIKLIDLLVSEPFIQEQTNLKPWRGSDNQKIHILNHNKDYSESDFENFKSLKEREIQLVQDGCEIFLIGIPKREDLQLIRKILAGQKN